MEVELPTKDEAIKFLEEVKPKINPDYWTSYLLGFNHLYTELGGENLFEVKK